MCCIAELQQYLPFTVLKLDWLFASNVNDECVATVLTVYGIETSDSNVWSITSEALLQQYLPFTVLKREKMSIVVYICQVATVLTVYGIET